MNNLPLLCAAALLGLALPAPQQASGQSPRGSAATGNFGAVLEKEIQGAWKLTKFETKEFSETSRGEVGYLLVTGKYFAFECHMGWMNAVGQRTASTFFSGTHSFEIGGDGVLRASSLIGTTVDPRTSLPMFEPPGRTRDYRVEVQRDTLTLERVSDRQRFLFTRLSSGGTEYDFYGRVKQPKPAAEGDTPR